MYQRFVRLGLLACAALAPTLVGVQASAQSAFLIHENKTATATNDDVAKYQWTFTKMVSPTAITLNQGQTGSVCYTLKATRTLVSDTDTSTVTGTISVRNAFPSFDPNPQPTQGLTITDQIQISTDGGASYSDYGPATAVDVSSHPVILPGETPSYPYSVTFTLSNINGVLYRNVAHIRILNDYQHVGVSYGPDAIAAFTLPLRSTTVVDGSADVTDVLTCPPGFVCSPSGTITSHFTDTGTVNFCRTIQDCSAPCNSHLILRNDALLVPSDSKHAQKAWANVDISTQDVVPPTIQCPSDLTVRCDKDKDDDKDKGRDCDKDKDGNKGHDCDKDKGHDSDKDKGRDCDKDKNHDADKDKGHDCDKDNKKGQDCDKGHDGDKDKDGHRCARLDPGMPKVWDNCPGVKVVGVRCDGKVLTDTYPLGTTTILWIATDCAGNHATCTQTIIVKGGDDDKDKTEQKDKNCDGHGH